MAMVEQILVGLRRIGLAGLRECFQAAEGSGATDREDLLDLMVEVVSRYNYIPPDSTEEYRKAVWREYMRHLGEDIRDLYSEIDVVVRGERGDDLDHFVRALTVAFGEHEIKPLVSFESPDEIGPNPQLLIDGEVVYSGRLRGRELHNAVRARITDW